MWGNGELRAFVGSADGGPVLALFMRARTCVGPFDRQTNACKEKIRKRLAIEIFGAEADATGAPKRGSQGRLMIR